MIPYLRFLFPYICACSCICIGEGEGTKGGDEQRSGSCLLHSSSHLDSPSSVLFFPIISQALSYHHALSPFLYLFSSFYLSPKPERNESWDVRQEYGQVFWVSLVSLFCVIFFFFILYMFLLFSQQAGID